MPNNTAIHHVRIRIDGGCADAQYSEAPLVFVGYTQTAAQERAGEQILEDWDAFVAIFPRLADNDRPTTPLSAFELIVLEALHDDDLTVDIGVSDLAEDSNGDESMIGSISIVDRNNPGQPTLFCGNDEDGVYEIWRDVYGGLEGYDANPEGLLRGLADLLGYKLTKD